MGHYKTIRGWIQLDKGYYAAYAEDNNKPPKVNFREYINEIKDWISTKSTNESKYAAIMSIEDSLHLHEGNNGSIFLFIGTSVKDYANEIEKFIKDFIKKFPICDGFIAFDEWEHEIEPREKIWSIKDGKISETRVDNLDFIK